MRVRMRGRHIPRRAGWSGRAHEKIARGPAAPGGWAGPAQDTGARIAARLTNTTPPSAPGRCNNPRT